MSLDVFYLVKDTNPTTQVFSWGAEIFVANNDATYLAWLTAGNFGFITSILSSADNGSGNVRLQVHDASDLSTGQIWRVEGSGAYGGNHVITKIDSTHIDLPVAYAGVDVIGANLQGAEIISTAAALWAAFDTYARQTYAGLPVSYTGAGPFTLANPPPSVSEININSGTYVINLQNMRTPRGVPKGREFKITHTGAIGFANAITILAFDGVTQIATIQAGDTIGLTLTDNSTTNGTFAITSSIYRKGAQRVRNASSLVSTASWHSFAIDEAVVVDSVGRSYTVLSAGGQLIINNVQGGPVAGGRDQAADFAAGTRIHVWVIWGEAVGNSLIATSNVSGPTLPTGYTHKCYVSSYITAGINQFPDVELKGNKVVFKTAPTISSGFASTWAPDLTTQTYGIDMEYWGVTTDGAGAANASISFTVDGNVRAKRTVTLSGLGATTAQKFEGTYVELSAKSNGVADYANSISITTGSAGVKGPERLLWYSVNNGG